MVYCVQDGGTGNNLHRTEREKEIPMTKYFMIFIALFGCYGTTSSEQICDTSSLMRTVRELPIVIDVSVTALRDLSSFNVSPTLGRDSLILNAHAGDTYEIHTEIDCTDGNRWSQASYVNDILISETSEVVGRDCSSLSEITLQLDPADGLSLTSFCM
jgi:hypothetical protein